VKEGENMNPNQQESLNYKILRISCKQQCAENSNSKKYFIFSTQVGKAWHFIFKTKKKKIQKLKAIANKNKKPKTGLPLIKRFFYSHIARLHTLDF
jgi:hypothetical protein